MYLCQSQKSRSIQQSKLPHDVNHWKASKIRNLIKVCHEELLMIQRITPHLMAACMAVSGSDSPGRILKFLRANINSQSVKGLETPQKALYNADQQWPKA